MCDDYPKDLFIDFKSILFGMGRPHILICVTTFVNAAWRVGLLFVFKSRPGGQRLTYKYFLVSDSLEHKKETENIFSKFLANFFLQQDKTK